MGDVLKISGKTKDDTELEKMTATEIAAIEKEYADNKGKVIDFLVERIMNVTIEFPINLKKKL